MQRRPWHAMDIEEVIKELSTDTFKGLRLEEVRERLERYGWNEIEEVKKRTAFKMLIEQFSNFLILILIIASIVSMFLGELIDSISILAIVVLMGFLGFFQEYRAEKSIEALRALTTPRAKVVREGRILEVESRELVPGDLIVLDSGDRIPADARLINASDMYVDESALTGESIPVEKRAHEVLDEKTPMPERVNMVYMGTYVVRGSGKAVVVATGMNSEVGRITRMVQEAEEEKTPLQKQLEILGRRIGVIILGVIGMVFLTGALLRGEDPLRLFMTSVALAVAAIPEGLPAIVTIVLAIGVWRMARKNAIVRRLSSVETLGAATVICTDKTGTITKNELTVRTLYLPSGEAIDLEDYKSVGENSVRSIEELKQLLNCFILCNNASLPKNPGEKGVGDPLEVALLQAASKLGVNVERYRELNPRLLEIPFTSQRKMMSTINTVDSKEYLYSKGAPEVILEKCKYALENGKLKLLDERSREEILSRVELMANKALRVLGFAYKPVRLEEADYGESLEKDMVFLGLAGLIDPPREGVVEAVKKAQRAGIKVIMVTGDHKNTAVAIAKEIGLDLKNRVVITGEQLEKMSYKDLEEIVDNVAIFARVNPEHKAKIVKALKARGHIVAMTGDGVNDAPALKLADIGVAMGLRGTDVAKEASDMILADDNFSTIVSAVEEGRVIYDNVRKPVNYLLSCNVGEVAAIFMGEMLGYGLIMEPLQILWMNLVTDALPAVGLGLEPPEPDVMSRKPRDPKEKIITGKTVGYYVYIGLIGGILALLAYSSFYSTPDGLLLARTAAFTTLVLYQLFHSINMRSVRVSIFKLGIFANKRLLAFVLVGLLLQLLAIGLTTIFHTVWLSPLILASLMIIASLVIPLEELRKKLGEKYKWMVKL